MRESLCRKKTKKDSQKTAILAEIVEKVSQLAKDEIELDAGLDELETGLTTLLDQIRQRVTQGLLEKQDADSQACSCGCSMINKQRLKREVIGLVPYTFHRRSFYCPSCQIYKCPLDNKMRVSGRYTLEVKSAIVLLGQRIPFEEASSFLQQLMGVGVSHECIQTIVEAIGKKIYQDEKRKVRSKVNINGSIKMWDSNGSASRPGTAYLEIDGCMVQTREEGWKEVRNGVLFRNQDRVQPDKHHKRILKKKYFSVFNRRDDSLNAFKDRATQEAYDFGFHQYQEPVIIGDGAKWIWDYASTQHPYATQILDYYHASEYLGDALQSIIGLNSKASVALNTQLFDWLSDGQIRPIIKSLNKQRSTEKIEDCIRYFENNIDRMKYNLYKDKGFDIGSGSIESAHRAIVQSRMKLAGMHWGKNNVQSIVSLRAKYLSDEWNCIVAHYLKAA